MKTNNKTKEQESFSKQFCEEVFSYMREAGLLKATIENLIFLDFEAIEK